jgi:hypothetical protein
MLRYISDLWKQANKDIPQGVDLSDAVFNHSGSIWLLPLYSASTGLKEDEPHGDVVTLPPGCNSVGKPRKPLVPANIEQVARLHM